MTSLARRESSFYLQVDPASSPHPCRELIVVLGEGNRKAWTSLGRKTSIGYWNYRISSEFLVVVMVTSGHRRRSDPRAFYPQFPDFTY